MERGVEMKEQEIKKVVRQRYARAATQGGGCGCGGVAASSCCGSNDVAQNISKAVGYSDEDIGAVPEGANLGLGCGNPVALASLKEGEVVLDLGAGGGFDCFLAAQKVGKSGRVIGVDMTPEMVARARQNAERQGFNNVEFRLGEIEHLPVADASVDVIISNCVVNLSPDKTQVYREAFRVLKPGGRLAISDVVAYGPLPEELRADLGAWSMCAAGALPIDELKATLESA